jgi:hypothetical protein
VGGRARIKITYNEAEAEHLGGLGDMREQEDATRKSLCVPARPLTCSDLEMG